MSSKDLIVLEKLSQREDLYKYKGPTDIFTHRQRRMLNSFNNITLFIFFICIALGPWVPFPLFVAYALFILGAGSYLEYKFINNSPLKTARRLAVDLSNPKNLPQYSFKIIQDEANLKMQIECKEFKTDHKRVRKLISEIKEEAIFKNVSENSLEELAEKKVMFEEKVNYLNQQARENYLNQRMTNIKVNEVKELLSG